MATNAELEILCKKLQARVEQLEAERGATANGSLPPEPEERPEVMPLSALNVPEEPAPISVDAAKHAEYVRPFVEEWEAKVEAEVEKRVKRLSETAYIPPKWKIETIRTKVAREIPYTGPDTDYQAYLTKNRFAGIRTARREAAEARKEGCPTGYWKDDTGLVRHIKTGDLYIAANGENQRETSAPRPDAVQMIAEMDPFAED